MWDYPEIYDVIVIGAGHAGCEAAHASAKMGARTLLLTMNLDTIAKMSCNPAVGGTAKGHIVREIDALGGIMGKIADRTGIQFRMLNASKGPAVWSPRCQSDKSAYALCMKEFLENVDNLDIKQATILDLVVRDDAIQGVDTLEGIRYRGKTVIVSSGTFMRGLLHIGHTNFAGGRAGDKPSTGLSKCLEDLGFSLGRLKTGTPPRINIRSVDLSVMEEQPGDEGVYFSYDEKVKKLPQVSCYIAYTNDKTKKLVLDNLTKSPMYSGKIESIGPRYCPSIEDKYVRFEDKKRHQLFLEPEGLNTNEVYVNGISTCLPYDVQYAMIRTVEGMENAEIMRPGYAIEYDYVTSGQQYETLETKKVSGLYLAGQVNGTTGYEEAAAQGLIAGVNATLKVQGKPAFSLLRSESYIGVMVDDLISKELTEPYRMFTSRAEHRLLLRQDNADLRLREYGYQLGLINKKQHSILIEKKKNIEAGIAILKSTNVPKDSRQLSLAQRLCHPGVDYNLLIKEYPVVKDYDEDTNRQIEIAVLYEGYIKRQRTEASKLDAIDLKKIPKDFDFAKVSGLRNEALEKLIKAHPLNLGQASRISGVSPADITVLLVALEHHRKTKA
ncbi:MAG: tRNA uridine 5-carboxymethylaminomethyl modification enzyme MnmG [Chlamydiia bacterium]|nr:tRNA uridine 5-carboxymethylaminomethyl modification enzyme MnmG [Chlamydiia bacterium]